MSRLPERILPTFTLMRGRFGPPAAQVFEQVRAGGVASRDDIAAGSGLSVATVGRVVTSLIESGVLRERCDLIREGAVGRPGVPVEIDRDRHLVIGYTIGRADTTVALGDLTGRVVAHAAVPHGPDGEPVPDTLSRAAARLMGRVPGRHSISVGLVAQWHEVGLNSESFAAELHELTGLPVRAGDRVAASAGAHYMQQRGTTRGSALYVYGGDTFGCTVVADRANRVEIYRGSNLGHFPIRADVVCPCGRMGCLQATAGDLEIAQSLHRAGLVATATIDAVYAAAGDPEVLAVLRQRAGHLGEATAVIRDMYLTADSILDRVIVIGGAYTRCVEVLDEVVEGFEKSSPYGDIPLVFASAGATDAAASCAVALGPVIEDPLAVMAGEPAERDKGQPARPAAVV